MREVIITDHARERWLERIADPRRYAHLHSCKNKENCENCANLVRDIRDGILFAHRGISGAIATAFKKAKELGPITDVNFLEAMKKYHGEEKFKLYEFYKSRAIFVTTKRPDEELPILVTVLSLDMLDGTVIKEMEPEDRKNVFNRWKFEARQRSKS